MANNVTTSGGNIATDQVGDGSHVQLVKIVSGTEDSIERIEGTAATGLEVDVVRAPADPFGTNLDAAAAVGGAASMQAKLRLMTSQLDAVQASVDTLLTNTQIRATALPVSGPLTDAQLRATALPIQLDAAALAALESTTATISGVIPINDNGGSITVDGPVTDAQLRAAPVQIGDNAGSLTVDGTVTANAGTGPWPITDNAGSITVDGPLTNTELRASGVTVVLPAGTNNIGDVDVLTVPADPFGANADAAVAAGAIGSIQAKLRRLTTDIDAIKTSVAAATPAGANNIGDVDVLTLPALVAGTANIGDVDVLTLPADPLGANADAAATAGSTGSISAKLRLMTTQLAAIQTAVETLDNAIAGSEMQVDIVSGSSVGTEYTEGGTDATITGTAIMWEDGSDTLRAVSAVNPLPTEIISGSFSLTSGADPLTVGGDSDLLVPTITVSTSAYSIGDVMGGRIQLTNALGTLRSGTLMSVVVSFVSAVTPALDIIFFNAQPTQNTADNAAFAWNSADDGLFLWKQSIETTDYFTAPGATARTFACVSPPAPILKSNGSQDLWMYVITRTAVTLTSTSGFRCKPGISRD